MAPHSINSNNNSSHGPLGVISGGNRVNSYGNLNSLAGGHQKTSSTSTSSSSRQPQQQQILLPKELFPSVSNVGLQPGASSMNVYEVRQQSSNNNNHNRTNHHTKPRPIKLPLRKHHSFHFQPSQTVAGSKQEKSYLKNYYKANGPLVFKPIKPVPATGQNSSSTSSTPSPTPPHTMLSSSSGNSNNINTKNVSHTSPRICGTRLKRHHSNVEPSSAHNPTNYEGGQLDVGLGIHTISNGNTALGVYGTTGRGTWDGYAGGGVLGEGSNTVGRRLHYVELDESFGQEHTRARREARRRPSDRGGGGLSCLSDDEGLKRRSRSAVAPALGSDYEVEGYLTGGETTSGDVNGGLVFGAFEEDRLNLKHFKDKYFLQPSGGGRTATNGTAGSGGQLRTPKRSSDTQQEQQHPQQLKSQSSSSSSTTVGNPKRTQYATLNFNEVNI